MRKTRRNILKILKFMISSRETKTQLQTNSEIGNCIQTTLLMYTLQVDRDDFYAAIFVGGGGR